MQERQVLVTGASGFVGPYLVRELKTQGWHVWALSRSGAPVEGATPVRADLLDRGAIQHIIQDIRPDVIFHLAAQSSVFSSFEHPIYTIENNTLGAANLLYSALDIDPKPRIIAIGSAEEYGKVKPNELPIDEKQPLAPISPYAVSKAAQTLLALSLHESQELPVTVLRPFNHTGPGQKPRLVIPSIAEQIARIEAGLSEPVIRVGNTESKRDFTDVRDIVKAYVLAVDRSRSGEIYNIGTGRSVSIQWILEFLVGQSKMDIKVETDPNRLRPSDIPELRCNPEKFRRDTGWEAHIPLEQTLIDILDYWRDRVKSDQYLVRHGRDTI